MEKGILALLCISIFISCGTEYISLKGNYDFPPYVIESERPYDEVWTTLIDSIAVLGFSSSTIDKESGIILFNESLFNGTFSREDDNGKLVNDKKYITVSRIKVLGEQIKPNRITAE